MHDNLLYSLIARGTTVLAEYRYLGRSMHTLSLPNLFEENHSPTYCNSGRDRATSKVTGRRIYINDTVTPGSASLEQAQITWHEVAVKAESYCFAVYSEVSGNANLVAHRILEKLPQTDRYVTKSFSVFSCLACALPV